MCDVVRTRDECDRREIGQLGAASDAVTATNGPDRSQSDDVKEYALSVVIPCRNAVGTVGGAIELLLAQPWPHRREIVVADNGSIDGSAQVVDELAARHDNVRLVDASGPPRAALARNVGALAARGRSLAFFDADDVPEPGWLAAMGNALEAHTFVACRLDTDSLNASWTLAVRGRPQDNDLPLTSFYPHLRTASGGTIGIRTAIFRDLGGFDARIPGGSEDVEFCLRVQLAGHPLVFVPDAVVKRRYRHSRRAMFAQARLWATGHRALQAQFREATIPAQLQPVTGEVGAPRPRSTWAKVRQMLGDLKSRGGRARWISAAGVVHRSRGSPGGIGAAERRDALALNRAASPVSRDVGSAVPRAPASREPASDAESSSKDPREGLLTGRARPIEFVEPGIAQPQGQHRRVERDRRVGMVEHESEHVDIWVCPERGEPWLPKDVMEQERHASVARHAFQPPR